MSDRTCEDCKFCLLQDYGYSNWTVEGTDFSCMRNAHPDGTFDRFYGEAPALKFAQQCQVFDAGEPVRLDVEGEDEEALSPEQKLLLETYRKGTTP